MFAELFGGQVLGSDVSASPADRRSSSRLSREECASPARASRKAAPRLMGGELVGISAAASFGLPLPPDGSAMSASSTGAPPTTPMSTSPAPQRSSLRTERQVLRVNLACRPGVPALAPRWRSANRRRNPRRRKSRRLRNPRPAHRHAAAGRSCSGKRGRISFFCSMPPTTMLSDPRRPGAGGRRIARFVGCCAGCLASASGRGSPAPCARSFYREISGRKVGTRSTNTLGQAAMVFHGHPLSGAFGEIRCTYREIAINWVRSSAQLGADAHPSWPPHDSQRLC